MNDRQPFDSFDELLAALETAASHPMDTAWYIFHYLQKNYKEMGSQQVRTLLAAYMKIPVEKPSLIHSCMLSMAVKISDAYPDFRFPQFLDLWGYDKNLRDEDRQRQTGKDGRTYLSLKEKVDRRLQSYLLHHQDEQREVADTVDVCRKGVRESG